ncbi:hypothetical protein R1sor_008188 [Riccia sorocarpa]|uniref:Protein kinase domain-containing protein n=1 Tax=Riccia sorocarpa TaxID=122646 RepID=A0ABD3HVI5_9MARC
MRSADKVATLPAYMFAWFHGYSLQMLHLTPIFSANERLDLRSEVQAEVIASSDRTTLMHRSMAAGGSGGERRKGTSGELVAWRVLWIAVVVLHSAGWIGQNGAEGCSDVEKQALLDLKALVPSPYADFFSPWQPESDCCADNWPFITCSGSRTVIGLNLPTRFPTSPFGLAIPEIPETLGNLASLESLSMVGNLISEVPDSLLQLANLTSVNLARNNISEFPEVFLKMTQIKKLDLSSNHILYMAVPDSSVPCELETLILRSNYIGNINQSFGGWMDLVELDLSGNFIAWIPDSVAELRNLQNLILDDNLLQTLPPYSVGKMTQLIKLSVSSNNITTLPTSTGSMTSLEYLNLKNNVLTKFPEMLLNLSNLVALDLSQNQIDGLPDSSYDNWAPTMEVLSLSGNLIESLPTGLASLELQDLWLDHNLINEFPPVLPLVNGTLDLSSNQMNDSNIFGRSCTGFRQLNLSNNKMTRIPYNLVIVEPFMEVLDLSGNLISQFDFNFASMISTQFRELDLANNNLTGRIPFSWGNLQSAGTGTGLEAIYLDGNPGLTVDIFIDIAQYLPRTKVLSVTGCNLAGEIPESLALLTELEVLSLDNNLLRGSIPDYFDSSFPVLRELNLSRNHLTGHIPSIPFNNSLHSGTTVLDLSFNNFTGPLPASIGAVTLLSHNSLSGEIPSQWSSIPIVALDLSDNQLGGTIPPFLSALSSLRYLNLANNSFTGDLPEELGNCTGLQHLVLENNLFNGLIPSTFGQSFGRSLRTLSLANNRLEGPIPDSIGNCSALRVLDLSRNNLNGSLPAVVDVDSLQNSLVVFTVAHNQLSGDLPWWITYLRSLELLDLSYNGFWGSLPSDVSGLEALKHPSPTPNNISAGSLEALYVMYSVQAGSVDDGTFSLSERVVQVTPSMVLTSNHFTGPLPPSLGNLTGLVYLSVAENNLDGALPPELGNLIGLQDLDLSYNNFSGPIPQAFSNLTSLISFNVSDNNLTGKLPQSALFSSFSTSSFLGNPGLCGNPLPLCLPSAPPAPAPSLLAGECFGWKCNNLWVIGVAIGAFVFFVVFVVATVFCVLRRKTPVVIFDSGEMDHKLVITAEELEAATADEHNVIGRGDGTTVYRVQLQEGKGGVVAVKKMKIELEERHDKKGQKRVIKEMEGLKQLRHRNLVSVLGVCYSGYYKSLILDYVNNGSLHDHLHEMANGKCELPLEARLKISTGVADALAFLHHEYHTPILHLDVKPSNILLDEEFNPKVTDFSIAKFINPKCNSSRGDATSVSVVGTPGYVAPEYGSLSRVSVKGDVYSFGMVLLELFTGKAPTDSTFDEEKTLRSWVMEACTSADADDILDVIDHFLLNQGKSGSSKEHPLPKEQNPNLNAFPSSGQPSPGTTTKTVRFGEETQMKQAQLVLGVALLCTHEEPDQRPSMDQVRDRLHHIRENHAVERDWPDINQLKPRKKEKKAVNQRSPPLQSKVGSRVQQLVSPGWWAFDRGASCGFGLMLSIFSVSCARRWVGHSASAVDDDHGLVVGSFVFSSIAATSLTSRLWLRQITVVRLSKAQTLVGSEGENERQG